MEELNNTTVNEATVTQAEVNNAVITQADVQCVPEQKKGMSTGQKVAGMTLIGFAILGIVTLVRLIVSGFKKVIGFFKKDKEAPAQQPAAAPAPVEQPTTPAPQETVANQTTESEQK